MSLQNSDTKSILPVLTFLIKMVQLNISIDLLVIMFVLCLKEVGVELNSGLMYSIIIYKYQMHLHRPLDMVIVLESFKLLERKIILLGFEPLVVEFGSVLLVNEKQSLNPTARKVSSLVLFLIQLGTYVGVTVLPVILGQLLMSDLMKV